jgi:hypothetical protein
MPLTGLTNSPAGIGLRRQPVDSERCLDENAAYKPGAVVHCTHMAHASSGVKFYRVDGTDGWIFNKRDNDQIMLTLV